MVYRQKKLSRLGLAVEKSNGAHRDYEVLIYDEAAGIGRDLNS